MRHPDTTTTRWYQEFWAWFIIGILIMAVVIGVTLVYFSAQKPDSLVADNYYDVGKGINQSLKREQLAVRLETRASVLIDNQQGTVAVQLEGKSLPQQLTLNLISPTQPERDRRIPLQQVQPGLYQGQMLDSVSGRRFVELLGKEGGEEWRLFQEASLQDRQAIQLKP